MRRSVVLLFSAFLGAAFAGACGSSGDASSASANGGASSSSGSKSSGSASGGASKASSSSGCIQCKTSASSGSGGAATLGCSADLHSVVDANGDVVTTCPNDQGCSNGACIGACDAAAASKGYIGCDFWIPTPPSYPPDLPPCFAVFLANEWPEAAKITVEYQGSSIDPTTFAFVPQSGQPEASWPSVPAAGLDVDQVAVLFMSGDPNSVFSETGESMKCPRPTAVNMATSLQDSGIGAAFHLTTSVPVSAYDILPYGGAHTHFPGATMLLPSTAWGTNYVVIATPPGTAAPPGPLWGTIVASQDKTNIQILPSVDLPAVASFAATPKNTTGMFTLDAGETLHFELAAGESDMSGSVVASDKPVAAFAGNRFFRDQPTPAPGGEEAHGEIPPVSALGSEYVAAPYATRRADLMPEDIPYRVVGAVDGTMLTYDPPVAGAPASLDASQVVDFSTTLAFKVTSQDDKHPFEIAQVMPTANIPGGTRPGATAPEVGGYPDMLGDEEFVGILPPKQFLSKYVFFTDPTYPTTNLVLTRVKGKNGFADVNIGCAGKVTGWQAVDASDTYEVTNVDLLRAAIPTGTCTNGRQTAESDAPFGVVVWGEDSYSSYAYPAGGTAAELTNVVVPTMPK